MMGYDTIENVQSWWEVPCIAHFCSLFRLYFELLDFDIEELEEALITDGVEDSGSSLLQDLIVRLLKGCFNSNKDDITSSNYQMYLRRLFRIKCEEDPTKNNPFDGDVAFHSLPLRTKVEILRDLCDFRLDNDDVSESLKTLEAESLRVEPLGQDSGGSTYWYFYGTRLYREDYSTTAVVKEIQPVKKRGKRGSKQEQKQKQIVTKWQVVCFTEEDWQILTQKFKNCKSPHERSLHRTLRDDFLPELPRLFAEKERLLRKRMLEKQLRRNGRSTSLVDDHNHHPNNDSSSYSLNGVGAGSSSSACNGTVNPCGSSGGGAKPRNSSTLSLPVPQNFNNNLNNKKSVESAAQRGYDDDNSWCEEEDDDDNNNKINAMDLDEEHSGRECSPDEEELRRKREEQERQDRLLAEAIEREERKARLHLRERRGGTFSSPSNAGSRNSSSVSTERPQSIKASTVSKQTVAAAVSKKNSKASPVKASPTKKKSSGKSKSRGHEKKGGGRMTNNSLSVSLSPLVDHDEEEDGNDKSHEVRSDVEEEVEDDDDLDVDDDFKKESKKKVKSLKSKKGTSKKKKRHSSKTLSRSPSPNHSPVKKAKKSGKSSPSAVVPKKKQKLTENDAQDKEENDDTEETHAEAEEEEFLEEEEEPDYEEIVARTLHNNNNNHKVKSEKEKKTKEKLKSKEKKSKVSGNGAKTFDDEEERIVQKKSSKEKGKDGSKKSKKSGKSGKVKEKDSSGKKLKMSKSEAMMSSSSGLIGASTISLGGGTSKTKVKSSVLFSQSEEDVQIGMHKVIEAIKNHRDAWPFINPVDEDYAPNYYRIIDHPMDLQTMEDKLDNQEYSSLDEFKADFDRIVDNCRKYNGPVSEYTEMVETVEGAFNKLIQRYIVPDESDEEISIEYTNATGSDRKRSSHSSSSKKKDKDVSKTVSVNSTFSKEHKKENEPTSQSANKSKSLSKLTTSSPTKQQKEKEKLERKKKKQQLMRHHSRDSEAIENLSTVAAETLKDINKWLGDTPKPPENYGTTSPASSSDTGAKPKMSEDNDSDKKTLKTGKASSTSPVKDLLKEKKAKKILSSSPPGSSMTAPVVQKRKLDFSATNKKVRSTQFVMDEDDEYNIDRDLSPPPPKIAKKKEESTDESPEKKKKVKSSGISKQKKDGEKIKEKVKKEKHHHHKHHHHHHHKSDSISDESVTSKPSASGTVKAKTGSGGGSSKKSASMSSSSSVSSLSTTSSSVQQKGKAKKPSKDESSSSSTVKKPKSVKRPGGSLGSGGNLLNTLKNSAAFKRMNQISRVAKQMTISSTSGEASRVRSDSTSGQPTASGSTAVSTVDASAVQAGGNGDGGSTAEKKKCLLISDLPQDKEGGPKLSLGSVLSTDAIKLGDFKENEDGLSEEDEYVKPKVEEVKVEKDGGDTVKKEIEEEAEEKEEDYEANRKLEPSKGFNREKCMPNLSAWIKAFGGPAKSTPGASPGGNSVVVTTSSSTASPLVSPVKKPDPDSKNKFRVMGRGVGEPDSGAKPHVPTTKPAIHTPPPHHQSVIKTSSLPSPSVSRYPVGISDPIAPSWSPVTPIPGPSPPSTMSNPLLNPAKHAALVAAERNIISAGEDLSSPPTSHSHHTSKKHRNRKMSSSSLSSQSESGSPRCVTSNQDGTGLPAAAGSFITSGSGGVVVNPPRWVDDHTWGPQSQSPSASSHVSSQSPAGPNSPFSPSISSPPPSTPQTPPRPPAPVRVGFYQDITASQHSSPDKVNESQSSPATPPTPNSVHGGSGSSGGSQGKRTGAGSGNARDSSYPTYTPRYVASSPSPNITGPASNASSGQPSPSTPPSITSTGGGMAESPGNPNSPHSPKVVNMSSANSSSANQMAADYRSHSTTGPNSNSSTSSSSSNGPQQPAHQQSSRAAASSVLHSTSPYGTPPAHQYSASASMLDQHLRNSGSSHQLPDPAHSHSHHPTHHHHQTPAHAHSNAPHAHSLSHLGQPQQAHAGSTGSSQYHDTSSSRYPPNLPHAHQQSSTSTSSTSTSSCYGTSGAGGSVGGVGSSGHQNLAQAHAHSRQSTSTPHLSHPYPSNPYASNPRSINVHPNVYSNPISSDPAMNRYYKAAMAAAATVSGAGGSGSELSLSIGQGSGGGSSSSSSSGTTSKRSSRSNASANAAPSPHSDIPRSASVNPTTAAAVAAALEAGKIAPGDLANGLHWPHNIASLTQIVNSIPGAYRHYTDPESVSKYQRAAAAAAAAAAQQESNSYPVTSSSASGGGSTSASVITSGSIAKSSNMLSGPNSSSHHHHSHSHGHHHHQSQSSEKGATDLAHHHNSSEITQSSSSTSSSKKQSKSSSSSSEAKSRSQSNNSSKGSSSTSSSTSGGGIVPGSAFNFSNMPDSLALYSKEMSDASSLYSASPPTLTPPLAHRASDFYPTASSASHFPHHSSFSAAAAARTTAGGVPTPPITPYPFLPGSHPSPYQAHQPVSSQPFAAHSQSSRGLEAYQQLFQQSPHVMGLLSHTSGYHPAPYAHPHSGLGFNRPGWI